MAKKRAVAGERTPSRRRGFSILLACSAGVVLLAVGAALLHAASSTSAALMRVSVFVVHYNPLVERKHQLQRQLRAQLTRLPPNMAVDVQWITEYDRIDLEKGGGRDAYYKPFRHLH